MMEKKEDDRRRLEKEGQHINQQPHLTPLTPTTHGAYGGGMYGTEQGQAAKPPNMPPASKTQSADGPAEAKIQPKYPPPPSSGDRDIDVTGQSYIQ
ncbi:hypothetical protein SLE2022_173610 [Rubroshorea leprosula]